MKRLRSAWKVLLEIKAILSEWMMNDERFWMKIKDPLKYVRVITFSDITLSQGNVLLFESLSTSATAVISNLIG